MNELNLILHLDARNVHRSDGECVRVDIDAEDGAAGEKKVVSVCETAG